MNPAALHTALAFAIALPAPVLGQNPLQGGHESDTTDASGFPVHVHHETIWWMDINFDPETCPSGATVLVRLWIGSDPARDEIGIHYMGHDSLLIAGAGGLTVELGDSRIAPTDTGSVERLSAKTRMGLRVAESLILSFPPGTIARMADSTPTVLHITGNKGNCDARLNPSDRHWIRQFVTNAGRPVARE